MVRSLHTRRPEHDRLVCSLVEELLAVFMVVTGFGLDVHLEQTDFIELGEYVLFIL